MMVVLSLFLVMTMFFFVNSLYYSLSLIAFSLMVLYSLVSNNMLHSLTMLMLVIVYVGAMMILIGYICAICPNMILSSSVNYYGLPISIFSFYYFFTFPFQFNSMSVSSVDMSNYFYSTSGVVVFLTLVFMLFITLLMVTSQYLSPKGPFRSVNI